MSWSKHIERIVPRGNPLFCFQIANLLFFPFGKCPGGSYSMAGSFLLQSTNKFHACELLTSLISEMALRDKGRKLAANHGLTQI